MVSSPRRIRRKCSEVCSICDSVLDLFPVLLNHPIKSRCLIPIYLAVSSELSDEEDVSMFSDRPVVVAADVVVAVPEAVTVPAVVDVTGVEEIAVFSGIRAFSISRMNCCDAFSYKSNAI